MRGENVNVHVVFDSNVTFKFLLSLSGNYFLDYFPIQFLYRIHYKKHGADEAFFISDFLSNRIICLI